MESTMRIGEVASQAGVNVQTLRYYERRGLLKEPVRRYTGERRYPPETVAFIRAIKRAQGLGFTLEEISHLLHADGSGQDLLIASTAAEKLEEVDSKLIELQSVRQRLAQVVDRGCNSLTDCECGQCPLEAPADLGDASQPSATVAPHPGRQSLFRRLLPTSLFAATACLACFLPAILAGGLGLGIVSAVSLTESVEVGLAAAAGAVAAGGAVLALRRPSHGSHCSCASH